MFSDLGRHLDIQAPDLMFSHSKLTSAFAAAHADKICLSGKVEIAAAEASATVRMWIRTYRDVALSQKAMDVLRAQALLISISMHTCVGVYGNRYMHMVAYI